MKTLEEYSLFENLEIPILKNFGCKFSVWKFENFYLKIQFACLEIPYLKIWKFLFENLICKFENSLIESLEISIWKFKFVNLKNLDEKLYLEILKFTIWIFWLKNILVENILMKFSWKSCLKITLVENFNKDLVKIFICKF